MDLMDCPLLSAHPGDFAPQILLLTILKFDISTNIVWSPCRDKGALRRDQRMSSHTGAYQAITRNVGEGTMTQT